MNIKQYIEEGYTIFADENIARLIRVDFPGVRNDVYILGDTLGFAGLTVDKVLIVSDNSLGKAMESIRATLWEAKEVAYIKRTKETVWKLCPKCIAQSENGGCHFESKSKKGGLSAEEVEEVSKALAEVHQRLAIKF